MEILDQEKFNKLMDQAAFGCISPFEKSVDEELPRMATFPGEQIDWVANVSVDRAMWGIYSSHGSGSIDVYVGVSPYRLVFFREAIRVIKDNKLFCDSYWFDIDFEDYQWHRIKRRKPIYFTGVRLDKPKFKKGMVSQTIRIKNLLTQDNGKVQDFFNSASYCEISSIKYIDPSTGKKVGRNADRVFNTMMEAYSSQIPVKASELIMLCAGTDVLEQYLALSEDTPRTEGQIVHTPEKKGKAKPEKKTARVASAEKAPKSTSAGTLKCQHCGQAVQQGWKVCPACGNPVALSCKSCGEELQSDWKVCPHCGEQP